MIKVSILFLFVALCLSSENVDSKLLYVPERQCSLSTVVNPPGR